MARQLAVAGDCPASDVGGFGLSDVIDRLRSQGAQEIIGMLSDCVGLRFMAAGKLSVSCPRVNPNGEDVGPLAKLMDASRRAGVYVVLEDNPFVPATAPGQLVATVKRPGNGPALRIFDLNPAAR